MPKYRKKPVVVEAEVYRPGLEDGFTPCIPSFMYASPWVEARAEVYPGEFHDLVDVPFIGTLENPQHYIGPGDWIVTGTQGERYPVKPDIFAEIYEPAEEELRVGDIVKIRSDGERFWNIIESIDGDFITARLDNNLVNGMKAGESITFRKDEIIDRAGNTND